MTDVIQGNIGSEGSYELDIEGGKLIAKAAFNGSQLGASLDVKLDLVAILEKVKEKIPGTIDDAVIGLVQGALVAQSPSNG